MSKVAHYSQSPFDTLKYTFDYSAWLAQGETLTSGAVAPEQTTSPPLVASSVAVSGSKLSFSIGGGVDGDTYNVIATVSTSQGQTKQDNFSLRVSVGANTPVNTNAGVIPDIASSIVPPSPTLVTVA
jgi:hypothetical protein